MAFFICGAHGKNLQANPNGELALCVNKLDWEKWTREDAGDGKFFICGAHGKNLQANPNGELALCENKLDWEKWTLEDAGDDKKKTFKWNETVLTDPTYDSGMLSSSSNHNNDPIGTDHGRGRLADNDRAWSAGANNQDQWWQINVPAGSRVTGTAVKGRPSYDQSPQFVTKWKFQYFWDGTEAVGGQWCRI